jgi:hypothetical protein
MTSKSGGNHVNNFVVMAGLGACIGDRGNRGTTGNRAVTRDPLVSGPPVMTFRSRSGCVMRFSQVAAFLVALVLVPPSIAPVVADAPKPTASAPAPTPTPTPPGPTPAPPDEPPDAKAVITLWDGRPVPSSWPLGFSIGLSSRKSVAGDREKSVRWRVDPAWIDAYSIRSGGGKDISVGAGVRPKKISVTLQVAAGDTFDETTVSFDAVPNPEEPDVIPTPTPVPPGPGPTPGPSPGPTPTPTPKLTGPLFATLFYDRTRQSLVSLGLDASVPAQLAALQCGWRLMEISEPEFTGLGFAGIVGTVGTPALVVQIADGPTKGTIVDQVKAPDAAGVVAEIKRLRGQ